MTVMFWMRRNPASTATNPFGYAFGDVTFRAFAAGAAGQGITFRGSAIGNVDSGFTVTGTPGVWQHVALVIDDAAGQAYWCDNGTPSATVINFPMGTFTYTQAGTRMMAVGAQGDSGLSTFGLHYDMDDFRFYDRALLPVEIMAAMATENASAGNYASGCAGPSGVPTIAGVGLPQLGNTSFAVALGNAEANQLAALVVGVAPVAFGTFDLSPWLGAGCTLHTDWITANFHLTVNGMATQPLGIPNNPLFAGYHLYSQWLVAGTLGAASPALDINLQ